MLLRNNKNNGVKHLAVSLKTKLKMDMPGEFHDYSWVFCFGIARVKVLGWLKKKERKKKKMTKLHGFSPVLVCHFSNVFEHSYSIM